MEKQPKIAKTRWYLFRLTDNTLLLSNGSFPTESAASRSMFQPATAQPDKRYTQLERRPGYDGVTTIKGEVLLKRMARATVTVA